MAKEKRRGRCRCCAPRAARRSPRSAWWRREEEEEEEKEFFNRHKNDLKRHAHTPSGVAGADL